MKYDDAMQQTKTMLDDEFDDDFEVFSEYLAGENKVICALQNWFISSGDKKAEFADDLEFAIREVKKTRTDHILKHKCESLLIDEGGRKDENGYWL